MAVDTDQLNKLLARADSHQSRLIKALEKLERRIGNLMADAPLRDGSLFDLEWAVNARASLRQAIETEYLAEVDSIIREYTDVADEVSTMLGAYGNFTTLDSSIISDLQRLSFAGFDDLGRQHLDIISKQIYEMTLTGQSFAESVAAVQSVVGDDMKRYATQQVHDSLMQFNRSVNTGIGLQSGATKFKYYGSKDDATREFCNKHVNKVYTKEQIEEIWSGEWAGKIDSNAFISAGGYNCRHQFRPVFDDSPLEKEEADEIEDEFELNSVFSLEKNAKEFKKQTQRAMSLVTAKQIALQRKIRQPAMFVQENDRAGGVKGFYSIQTRTISADPKEMSGMVMRHEYGHHVDFELGEAKYGRYTALSEVELKKAYQKDRQALGLVSEKTKRDRMFDLREEVNERVEYLDAGGIRRARWQLKEDNLAFVSDIIDSMTLGDFQTKMGMWGHGRKYYKNAASKQHENFANLYALRNTPHWESHVKRLFPNLAEAFDKIIDEALGV